MLVYLVTKPIPAFGALPGDRLVYRADSLLFPFVLHRSLPAVSIVNLPLHAVQAVRQWCQAPQHPRRLRGLRIVRPSTL